MVKENGVVQRTKIATFTRDRIWTTKRMDMEYTNGRVAISTKGNIMKMRGVDKDA
jgi:hypothetical protein